MLLLHSKAVVKLGCLFHPAVEAGRSLPGEGKAPATKGASLHPSSITTRIPKELGELPLPGAAQPGRAAWADTGWKKEQET